MSICSTPSEAQIPILPKPSIPKTEARQYPKWFGGSASCLAVVCSHPLDLIKVQLQATPAADRKNVIQTVTQIIRTDGAGGLYRGLSAGVMRQLTYGSARFAIYESLKEQAARQCHGPPSTIVLLTASTLSGFGGAIIGNPADIANNYKSVVDALARIARVDGLSGFFRGIVPNSVRAGAITGCQLGSYDAIKQSLIVDAGFKDSISTQLMASILAGFIATTICNPIDVIKTRSMSQAGNTSVWSMIKQLSAVEGFRWTLRGWLPSFARLGPHTAATLLILEQHRAIYDRLRDN